MDERDIQHLTPIDIVAYNEGELVGYFLGVPYDWDVLDPYLMRKPEKKR